MGRDMRISDETCERLVCDYPGDPTDAELDEIEARLKRGDNFLIRKDAWTLYDALRACRKEAKAKDAALELFLKYMEHPDVEHARQLWEKEMGGVLLTSVPINQAIAALDKKPDD